jgi:uncharacterized protein
VSGHGTVWSFVVAHAPLLPAYAGDAPYPVITVMLGERPDRCMVENLVTRPRADINSIDPATIQIGEPVRIVFASVERPEGGQFWWPQWVRHGNPN